VAKQKSVCGIAETSQFIPQSYETAAKPFAEDAYIGQDLGVIRKSLSTQALLLFLTPYPMRAVTPAPGTRIFEP
jgi:hypothetical protein